MPPPRVSPNELPGQWMYDPQDLRRNVRHGAVRSGTLNADVADGRTACSRPNRRRRYLRRRRGTDEAVAVDTRRASVDSSDASQRGGGGRQRGAERPSPKIRARSMVCLPLPRGSRAGRRHVPSARTAARASGRASRCARAGLGGHGAAGAHARVDPIARTGRRGAAGAAGCRHCARLGAERLGLWNDSDR